MKLQHFCYHYKKWGVTSIAKSSSEPSEVDDCLDNVPNGSCSVEASRGQVFTVYGSSCGVYSGTDSGCVKEPDFLSRANGACLEIDHFWRGWSLMKKKKSEVDDCLDEIPSGSCEASGLGG